MNARCGGLSERNLKHHPFENKSTQTAFTDAENFLSPDCKEGRQADSLGRASRCCPLQATNCRAAGKPAQAGVPGLNQRGRRVGPLTVPVAGRTELGLVSVNI